MSATNTDCLPPLTDVFLNIIPVVLLFLFLFDDRPCFRAVLLLDTGGGARHGLALPLGGQQHVGVEKQPRNGGQGTKTLGAQGTPKSSQHESLAQGYTQGVDEVHLHEIYHAYYKTEGSRSR
jgi:hypothetical protein